MKNYSLLGSLKLPHQKIHFPKSLPKKSINLIVILHQSHQKNKKNHSNFYEYA